jgi:hypothetical protein
MTVQLKERIDYSWWSRLVENLLKPCPLPHVLKCDEFTPTTELEPPSGEEARNMASKGKDLVDVGWAEVRRFLGGFQLHVPGLWL